jgi:hypothetical protein
MTNSAAPFSLRPLGQDISLPDYNLLMLITIGGALWFLWRGRPLQRRSLLAASVAVALLGLLGLFFANVGGFGLVRLAAWSVFLHAPLFLLGVAALSLRQKRAFSSICLAGALALWLIALDAFLIEPRWLQVQRVTLPITKLSSPLRIALIADLQTDAPGDYERHAVELAQAANPDLILLAGDYVHIASARYAASSQSLNELLREAALNAPLGIYAVRGNVDPPGEWREIFAGLPVQAVEATSAVDLGPVYLTLLSLADSANSAPLIPPRDKPHIVLGHRPDYALGQSQADLLLAGHTHGGQVRLPVIGPIMTLSQVPRAWADGVTQIAPGRTLIVSRGIGMERMDAPPLRFLCRPELLIIDLAPAAAAP